MKLKFPPSTLNPVHENFYPITYPGDISMKERLTFDHGRDAGLKKHPIAKHKAYIRHCSGERGVRVFMRGYLSGIMSHYD